MSKSGEWNIILSYREISTQRGGPSKKIYVVPLSVLHTINNPQILGVVSTSTQSSFKICQDQESYNNWLFYYGYDPSNPPEIVYYGSEKKE